MKKIGIAILGVVVIGLVVLLVIGEEMQEIKTEIEIAAPPEKVWDILMDFDKWQEWSPIIKISSGRAELGNKLGGTKGLNSRQR